MWNIAAQLPVSLGFSLLHQEKKTQKRIPVTQTPSDCRSFSWQFHNSSQSMPVFFHPLLLGQWQQSWYTLCPTSQTQVGTPHHGSSTSRGSLTATSKLHISKDVTSSWKSACFLIKFLKFSAKGKRQELPVPFLKVGECSFLSNPLQSLSDPVPGAGSCAAVLSLLTPKLPRSALPAEQGWWQELQAEAWTWQWLVLLSESHKKWCEIKAVWTQSKQTLHTDPETPESLAQLEESLSLTSKRKLLKFSLKETRLSKAVSWGYQKMSNHSWPNNLPFKLRSQFQKALKPSQQAQE